MAKVVTNQEIRILGSPRESATRTECSLVQRAASEFRVRFTGAQVRAVSLAQKWQRPLVQGTLLQQSPLVVQICPVRAHVVDVGVQLPEVLPSGSAQRDPTQQSPSEEHDWPLATHVLDAQT
jgi:hypothetical protein